VYVIKVGILLSVKCISDDDLGKKVSAGIFFYWLNVNGKTEAIKKCVMLNQQDCGLGVG